MTLARTVLGVGLAVAGYGQSVWLPAPRQAVLTPSFVYQRFDRFWMGTMETHLGEPVPQRTVLVGVEYGISRRWAADFTAGYTGVRTTAFGGTGSDAGLTDTLFGVRYRLRDETGGRRWLPALALRAGGIKAGTYRPNFPFSAGDGASGAEVSVLWGKAFSDAGFGAYGDLGYRKRSRGVPDDTFGSAGVFKTVRKASLSAGYRHVNGLSGMNIGDAGFTFPRLKEQTKAVEFGLGFPGKGVWYQLFSAHVLGGRNTGAKLVVGVSASFRFRAAK
jgi:hypothetical protein